MNDDDRLNQVLAQQGGAFAGASMIRFGPQTGPFGHSPGNQGCLAAAAAPVSADRRSGSPKRGLLQRELGPDGLARFLRLNRSGNGNYTGDREHWQENLTLDQILESIRQHRPQ